MIRNAYLRRSCLTVLMGALFLPLPAFAIELGEWVPGFTFRPFVQERVEYESNVFLAPSHAQDDIISKTIPGFELEYKQSPLTLSSGYRAEILRFADLTKQNNVHHQAMVDIRVERNRFKAGLRDDFLRTSDPPGTELTGRVESTTNTLKPEVELRLSDRLAVGVDYSWTRVNFERRVEALDRDENLVGGSIFWKVLPKTDIRLSYAHGEKSFDTAQNRDVTRNLVLFGVRGDLTARLSSTFRVGYESREPDRRGFVDFQGFVMGGGWTYRPTDRTTINLNIDRSAEESVFANAFFFKSTVVTADLSHEFIPKLKGLVGLLRGSNDYPVRAADRGGRLRFRADSLIGWRAELNYEMPRLLPVGTLSVGAEFAHTTRDSNFNEFRYQDDKVTAKVKLEF